MLSWLLILPEGKTEVERSYLGQVAEALGIISSHAKGLGEALGPSEEPSFSGRKIQAGDPNGKRDAWDAGGMI